MRTILVLFLFFSSSAFAKSFDTYGAVPFLSLAKELGPKYDLNFYHSDTFNFTGRNFNHRDYPSRDLQTYFQTSIGYKFLPNLNFAIGHIYQRNNPLDVNFNNENRAFEQLTYSQTFDSVKLTHRVRFEQRFINERKSHEFRTRLRYQIGASFPLQGRQLDPGEWYFNCYNEFYFSTTGTRNALYSDDWAYAGLGYQTFEWGKFEFGPLAQYSVIDKDRDFRSFYALQMGWIYKF